MGLLKQCNLFGSEDLKRVTRIDFLIYVGRKSAAPSRPTSFAARVSHGRT